jgi:hypothetical protein
MTCNENEQQQGAKNNVELWTKWTKTTWRTSEESIERCRNGSVKAFLGIVDDGDDDDDDDDSVI